MIVNVVINRGKPDQIVLFTSDPIVVIEYSGQIMPPSMKAYKGIQLPRAVVLAEPPTGLYVGVEMERPEFQKLTAFANHFLKHGRMLWNIFSERRLDQIDKVIAEAYSR
ncbi:MAG: hypothetical protein ACRDHZ_00155 [Ktedonobacteraceae bacterium]